MKNTVCFMFMLALLACGNKSNETPPFQATGIKIGEVTDSSAIVWTRLTKYAEKVGKEAPKPKVIYQDDEGNIVNSNKNRKNWTPIVEFTGGSTIETIEGAVPGEPGEILVEYKTESSEEWISTGWQSVSAERDFTKQVVLSDLLPASKYLVRVSSRNSAGAGEQLTGSFSTAPLKGNPAKVLFCVTTGTSYGNQDAEGGGYRIYNSMLKMKPDFFVHTGDILYYDKLAKTKDLALWQWQRMYSLPTNIRFHKQIASYFMKDDHDTWMNDCWPTRKTKFMGDFTFQQGQQIFLDEVPMGEKTYRTVRWGKDLQIWLMEGRDFRSPNNMPDGPDKSIWGKEQMEWLKSTVTESDASFKILISPTPIVGPDRQNKNDNHANEGFAYEGDKIREFISKQKNMFVVCGDRHWQYVSKDLKYGVREYSCGPASDSHAGGWSNDKLLPEHIYLNVIGGFLSVEVDRNNAVPEIVFTHHGVDGQVYHSDVIKAEMAE